MSEVEAKRRNRRESNQIQEGMVSLNATETKKVVIDNNFNTRNLSNLKNENESPRKEKGINDKEDVEKRNKVDKEGDAVMVVWKDEPNKNNNRESGLFGLDVNTKTEVNEEPVSPSPRAGGRDAWSERGEAEQPSQLSFNVRGTIERRKKVYMGSKSGHIGRYRYGQSIFSFSKNFHYFPSFLCHVAQELSLAAVVTNFLLQTFQRKKCRQLNNSNGPNG